MGVEATKASLKSLINQMYKAEASAHEKGEGPKPKPVPKEIKESKKESKEVKVTNKMKEIVKGFFQPPAKEKKEVVDLFVGDVKLRKKKATKNGSNSR